MLSLSLTPSLSLSISLNIPGVEVPAMRAPLIWTSSEHAVTSAGETLRLQFNWNKTKIGSIMLIYIVYNKQDAIEKE